MNRSFYPISMNPNSNLPGFRQPILQPYKHLQKQAWIQKAPLNHEYKPGEPILRPLHPTFGGNRHENRCYFPNIPAKRIEKKNEVPGSSGFIHKFDQPFPMQPKFDQAENRGPETVERKKVFPFLKTEDGSYVFDRKLVDRDSVVLNPKQTEVFGLTGFGKPLPLVEASNPDVKHLLRSVNPRKRKHGEEKYSRKVVLGNIYDVPDKKLLEIFHSYEVQGKIVRHKGNEDFCFLTFKHPDIVETLIENCVPDEFNFKYKVDDDLTITVFPWANEDTAYTFDENWPIFTRHTIFIGSLPRICTSSFLFNFLKFKLKFWDLLHVRIDCDPQLYPRGAARAVFRTEESYRRACKMHMQRFSWFNDRFRIEFKSFIYKGFSCEHCGTQVITKFCPSDECLRYYCDACWPLVHNKESFHRPVLGQYRDVPYITKNFEEVKAFHVQRKIEELTEVMKADREKSTVTKEQVSVNTNLFETGRIHNTT